MDKVSYLFVADGYPDSSAFTQNISRTIHALRTYGKEHGRDDRIVVISSSSFPKSGDSEQYYRNDAEIINQFLNERSYKKRVGRHKYHFFIESPLWQSVQVYRQSVKARRLGTLPVVLMSTQYLWRFFFIILSGFLAKAKVLCIRTEKPLSLHSDSIKRSKSLIRKRESLKRQFYTLYKRLDGLIVETDYLERYYRTLTKGKIPICILPTLLDPNINNPITKESKEKFIVSYAGGLAPGKHDGVMYLVEAARWLNREDIEIHVIGNALDKKFVATLHVLASNASKTKVLFFHNLSREEYHKALVESDLLVLYKEKDYYTNAGMSSKLIEYLQCGKPVILTKYVNTYPMNLTNGVNVFFAENNNSKRLYEKIKEVLSLPRESLNAVGEAGFYKINHDLAPDAHISKLVSFVLSLK